MMVLVGISQLGCTGLVFAKPGTNVDGAYYRDVLCKHLLSAIRNFAVAGYTFQQDSAPAHRARDTVELLRRETLDLHSTGPVVFQQVGPQPRRLPNLGSAKGAGVTAARSRR